ncbi:MAG: hypothetical protein IPL12_05075 [Bacteroidetes bacterium]|nr:hypothetical protein [Bacteroidota bacterium]
MEDTTHVHNHNTPDTFYIIHENVPKTKLLGIHGMQALHTIDQPALNIAPILAEPTELHSQVAVDSTYQ